MLFQILTHSCASRLLSVFARRRKGTRTADTFPTRYRSEWMLKHRNYSNKSYRLGRFEALLAGHGFTRKEALTFGFEFRVLRRLHLVPAALLDALELHLERIGREFKVPYLSRSGWGYLGLFSK